MSELKRRLGRKRQELRRRGDRRRSKGTLPHDSKLGGDPRGTRAVREGESCWRGACIACGSDRSGSGAVAESLPADGRARGPDATATNASDPKAHSHRITSFQSSAS